MTLFSPCQRLNAGAFSLVLCCTLALAACSAGKDAHSSLGLPAGNPEAGRKAFVSLRCNDCHSTTEIRLRDAEQTDIHVPLGQSAHQISTERALLMAIVSPSHQISVPVKRSQSGASPMPPYTDIMLVQELVDIMAMLRPEFGLPPLAPSPESP